MRENPKDFSTKIYYYDFGNNLKYEKKQKLD